MEPLQPSPIRGSSFGAVDLITEVAAREAQDPSVPGNSRNTPTVRDTEAASNTSPRTGDDTHSSPPPRLYQYWQLHRTVHLGDDVPPPLYNNSPPPRTPTPFHASVNPYSMTDLSSRRAPFTAEFIIVGGSISGLATAYSLALGGHRVRVLERSPGLSQSGGGVRLPPNFTKILVQWGLEDKLLAKASPCRGSKLWDMETGELLGYLGWAEDVIKESGAMFYMMHYRDLQELLYNAAVSVGAQVLFDATVANVTPPPPFPEASGSTSGKPSVTLTDGQVFHADVIVGADGPRSVVRTAVEEEPIEPQWTGTTVFTGNLRMEEMMKDDILRKDEIAMGWPFWFGAERACMGYAISHDEQFTVHFHWDDDIPDAPEGWAPNVSTRSLKYNTDTVDIRLRRLLDTLGTVSYQRWMDWPKVQDWVDESESIVLTGEAARPLMPGSTHGCSMSVEGAAVFGTLFSHLRSLDQIPTLLYAYQDLRQPRAELLHRLELTNASLCMFPPGPERDARNLHMRKSLAVGSKHWDEGALEGQWAEISEVWGYNAIDAADDWWVQWGVLRERALYSENPDSNIRFDRLEVSVQGTNSGVMV
ncbi:FAD/NAD(P)-binding domain-containing protein [Auriscalpium vulgare]|uniref:FAD/NAD(P)-binding domain-containing protein n=1 Tax=Auriscalpium vulgare TaxID=40419 RepID=A0ACB8RPC2_9AGAM|nr:FAD/NAD(P)-binding domain-containing protein [Auriscalpium vulgare]